MACGPSMRQRIGPQLEVHGDRLGSFAAFLEPGGSVTACGPQPPALPARVALIDPGVIAGFGAVLAEAFKPRTGILIKRPALRTMISGGGRPIEHLALAPVEARQ